MTEGKMKRILNEYIEKYGADTAIYKIFDRYANDKETPRIVYTISSLLEEFEKKEGVLYEQFHIKTSFMELLKRIDKNDPLISKIVFKDTFDQWKKENPDWKEQLQAEEKKARESYEQLLSMYRKYVAPYEHMTKKVFA